MSYPKVLKKFYHRIVGRAVATVLRPGAAYDSQNFELWQRQGYHILPLHFYSPIPDTRMLEAEGVWTQHQEAQAIEWNVSGQIAHLSSLLAPFGSEFAMSLRSGTLARFGFHLPNDAFVGIDPVSLYAMVRHYRPGQIVEIGSGHSSRVMAASLLENGAGKLTSIDPYPNKQLSKDLLSTDYEVIDQRVQQIPLEFFDRLRPNDILFIDSSHTVRVAGDVNYLLLEVIPRLQPGVLVHFHDIFLPDEYPREYILEKRFFWAEQYLLHAFLLFNTAFEILLANHYLTVRHLDHLIDCFPEAQEYYGGSFWIRRCLQTPDSV